MSNFVDSCHLASQSLIKRVTQRSDVGWDNPFYSPPLHVYAAFSEIHTGAIYPYTCRAFAFRTNFPPSLDEPLSCRPGLAPCSAHVGFCILTWSLLSSCFSTLFGRQRGLIATVPLFLIGTSELLDPSLGCTIQAPTVLSSAPHCQIGTSTMPLARKYLARMIANVCLSLFPSVLYQQLLHAGSKSATY